MVIRVGQFDALRGGRSLGIAAFGVVLMFYAAAAGIGLRFNESPSLPIGIYVVTGADSDLVEFCPAEPHAAIAAARGYRQRGNCPDGAAPLMKPIAARAADIVEFTADGIAINHKALPNTAPRPADTSGRALEHFPFGTYTVSQGTVWVASTYNSRSYDSRYFGPVATAAIRDHLRPLMIMR
jgi:conjugative transfer signal peptidase TraF